ncbi:twin-arginine translocase subunit TatC [Limnospira fusiformis SAG 85.79]|uniref:Sec-independent protein translocase protein TatC n=4 Tax=Limnospira TaxID=2596745 RepID=A0A9P1KJY9_9CYAN|nr:Sec-independent protein translocase TatC subunit [Arthrospira platensis C1]QJB24843.1 twin-arginine translocase subunit TatC [Limnospira fusiformis SAG 85.79]QNH57123.1 MAG: twin-arginine translocase subunit TatC [Limnospira indica BM01]UWU46460.1 sec-independent protein translocase protein TatC [Arthrospira platensis C1]CDM97759.1 Sec-independent protein translocase TatC subunit [Limnospira indica PCC 8005]
MEDQFSQSPNSDAYEALCQEATVLHQRITNLKQLLAETERENQKLRAELEAKETAKTENPTPPKTPVIQPDSLTMAATPQQVSRPADTNGKNGQAPLNGNGSVNGSQPATSTRAKSSSTATLIKPPEPQISPDDDDYLNQIPDDVEMSLFDHLEELRQRIFYSLISVVVGIVICFIAVKPIVQILKVPAQGVKLLQLAPGEYFFVSLKVAGYSGLLVASPFIIFQIIQFVLPGLTLRERRFLGPVFLGSTFLFLIGLVFAYLAIVPAALTFFINYGSEVVEQLWSISEYFEFVLKLLLVTAIAFQVPIIQILLGILGIVSSQKMLSIWRYVVMGAAIMGAFLTPSTDPLTQSLLGGAIVFLYFGGVGAVKLLGK